MAQACLKLIKINQNNPDPTLFINAIVMTQECGQERFLLVSLLREKAIGFWLAVLTVAVQVRIS